MPTATRIGAEPSTASQLLGYIVVLAALAFLVFGAPLAVNAARYLNRLRLERKAARR